MPANAGAGELQVEEEDSFDGSLALMNSMGKSTQSPSNVPRLVRHLQNVIQVSSLGKMLDSNSSYLARKHLCITFGHWLGAGDISQTT